MLESFDSPSKTTAVLIFGRSAQVESRRKKLSRDYFTNKQLHKELVERTKIIARSTGIPVILHNEKSQTGATFGERISNSIAKVFADGFDNIIVIGTDCPELTTHEIFNAEQIIQKGRFAIGKDERGGAYLIGLSKQQFQREYFESLRWSTDEFAFSLKKYANQLGYEVHELGVKSDVNTLKDVDNSSSRLIKLILREINNPKPIFGRIGISKSVLLIVNDLLRGPPERMVISN